MQVDFHGAKYEWDDNKDAANRKRHGLSFKSAIKVFADLHRVERYDDEHSEYEERFIVIGMLSDTAVVIQCVYTPRNETIRMISARKATNEERREYYDRY